MQWAPKKAPATKASYIATKKKPSPRTQAHEDETNRKREKTLKRKEDITTRKMVELEKLFEVSTSIFSQDVGE